MTKKLNEKMAEVMGWHKGKGTKSVFSGLTVIWWRDSNDEAQCKLFDWNPTEDLNQAVRCVFKSGASKVSITEVDVDRYMASIYPDCFSDDNKPTCKISNTASLAICEAIREAILETR